MNQHLENFFSQLPQVNCATFDIGNTNPHRANFEKGVLKSVLPLSLNEINYDEGIVCSVNSEVPSSPVFQNFKGDVFLEMPCFYSETLGHDRLSLAHLAYNLFQGDTVIIDAGTFITVDFVNESGFQGGYIIPGLKALADSYSKGDQLTSATLKNSPKNKWPQNTKEAISSGLELLKNGLYLQIQRLIPKDSKVVLTGGNRSFLEGAVKADLEHDHLLHYALYFQHVKGQTNR